MIYFGVNMGHPMRSSEYYSRWILETILKKTFYKGLIAKKIYIFNEFF